MTCPGTGPIAQLTASMAAGDGAAIEGFYRRWSPAMVEMARAAVPSRSRDEAFALDVLHDAMLRIVRCIKPMDAEAHLLNWTRLFVQSCAMDMLRSEQRRRRREATRRAAPDPRSPPATLDASEQIAWLAATIETLDPTLADMLRLRFGEGWTLARIATRFRTSTGRVDGQLRRAVERLRLAARTAFDE